MVLGLILYKCLMLEIRFIHYNSINNRGIDKSRGL